MASLLPCPATASRRLARRLLQPLHHRAYSSMAYYDPYALLGVQHGCSDGELKKAYRKAAFKCHPDTATASGADPAQAEVRFKQLSEAYETILGQRTARPPSGAQPAQQHAWGEQAYAQGSQQRYRRHQQRRGRFGIWASDGHG